MADELQRVGNLGTNVKRLADQGDGTVAEVVAIAGGVSLDAGDIEIGGVEIKDGATDARAKVGTGIATTDNAVAVADPTSRVGDANLTTGLASIPTTANGTEIVAARAGRRGVIVRNRGSQIVYVGQGTITASMWPLDANDAMYFPLAGQIKGLSASGTQSVAFAEVY